MGTKQRIASTNRQVRENQLHHKYIDGYSGGGYDGKIHARDCPLECCVRARQAGGSD